MKTSIFEQLPTIIVVQLRRFSFVGGRYIKSTTPVEINPHIVIPTVDESNEQNNISYVVTGSVHHDGNFQAGHYIANVVKDGHWFHCNDSVVNQTTLSDLEDDNVYVLLYQREDDF